MAAFGFSIYDKNNVDVTGVLTPVFFLDRFTTSSGSKTYPVVPRGKKLHASHCLILTGHDPVRDLIQKEPLIKIEGNTVTWSGMFEGAGSFIYTYWR
ncbi:TPA: hypothetical protein PJF95_005078 [Escherichia coli]|nr:hypothetical protein [Escherichia coli]ELC8119260.1 hypothetical protein [Escherichia coli]HBN7445805.1 hypothetical protein [Escherichia coli]HDH7178330.1 hypothetical protein [Escherichia coli]